MRKRTDWLVSNNSGMVDNLLEFAGCGTALFGREIRLAAQVDGIERKSESRIALAQFVRYGRNERFDGLRAVAVPERQRSMNHRQIIGLHNCVFGETFRDIAGQLLSFHGIAREPQRDCRESDYFSSVRH